MPSKDSAKVLIVAAEASSCLYAQRLLEHWRDQGMRVEAFGIGDESMQKLGFECLGRAEDLAVVGLQEVISHWGVIKKAFHDLVSAAETRKPDVVLLLDYPGFNLRFAKKIKKMAIPVVYYISPQVWAWRQGRVHTIKKLIDKMLVVFPFEVDFYRKHDVQVEFVGHPLLDELKEQFGNSQSREIRRAKYGVGPGDILLALMPGSRVSELKHHIQTQLDVARELVKRFPHLKLALLVAPNFSTERVREWIGELDFPLMLIKDEPFSMIDLADVVLCASGTATLMVGLLEKPMVIMYKMNALTAFLAKMFVRSTEHFGLINLVLGERVATELFQDQANTQSLIDALVPLIEDSQTREELRRRLSEARNRLGSSGATIRVAQALEEYWKGSSHA